MSSLKKKMVNSLYTKGWDYKTESDRVVKAEFDGNFLELYLDLDKLVVHTYCGTSHGWRKWERYHVPGVQEAWSARHQSTVKPSEKIQNAYGV